MRALQEKWGVGVSGLVLISPRLDFHTESGYADPLGWVDRLPAEAAVARAKNGPVRRADLADAEAYASGEFIVDLLKGVRDRAAVDRLVKRVSELTGIDPAVVARGQGRLDADVFLHEIGRDGHRIMSIYDGTLSTGDPFGRRPMAWSPDAGVEGLLPIVTSSMVVLYNDRLKWRPDGTYRLSNNDAFRQWDWGRGMDRPQSLSFLQVALALDPKLKVLIAHGLFDLRTPYFTTARQLALLADDGSAQRVKLEVYPGGHMFYSVDASRVAFRAAAEQLYRP